MPRRKRQSQMDALIEEQQDDDATDAPMEEIETEKEPAEPVRYEIAPDTVSARVNRIIQKYHKDLMESGATISCEFAIAGRNSKGVKPAIIQRGHPQLAKIKRNDVHCRLNGDKDALLIIDKEAYEAMNAPKQDALIDHMLSSLVVKREGNKPEGEILRDNAGRPVLKIKHHETVLEIHDSVLRRHQADSPNFGTISKLVDDFKQLEMFPTVSGSAAA